MMRKLKNKICKVSLILGILFISNIIFAQDGKELFEDNCAVCHTMGMKVVGPDLIGVGERRSNEWITAFIKNSTEMVEAGDLDAIKVFEENGKVPMSPFKDVFSEDEFASLVEYLVEYKAEPVIVEKHKVEEKNITNKPTVISSDKPMSTHLVLLIAIITVPFLLIILLILSVLFKILDFEKKVSGEEQNVAMKLFTGEISDEVIEGHSYDGIMELNNGMPPWLKWLFYATIVGAVSYILHFEILETGPSQIQEYENEMVEAVKIYGDMNIVSIQIEKITDKTALEIGKEVYNQNCVACHKEDGSGSVGPNLTDNYWKNGGSLEEIFNTIRNGVPGKAMVAWKGKISDKNMLSIASFIKNMKGTNPKGGKEPEGIEYKGK